MKVQKMKMKTKSRLLPLCLARKTAMTIAIQMKTVIIMKNHQLMATKRKRMMIQWTRTQALTKNRLTQVLTN